VRRGAGCASGRPFARADRGRRRRNARRARRTHAPGLLLALGGAFAAVAAYRVVGQRRSVTLPPDVFEMLGEAPLGGQQSVRVIRFGPRTLLVAVSAAGARTLAEVNDPQVTERIVSACHGLDGARTPGRGLRRPPAERPEARS